MTGAILADGNEIELSYDGYDGVLHAKDKETEVDDTYTILGSMASRTQDGRRIAYQYDIEMSKTHSLSRRTWQFFIWYSHGVSCRYKSFCAGRDSLYPQSSFRDSMVKVFWEAVKSPVRRKRQGDVKTAVVCDEKVVVQVIGKVGNHGETFAFHNDKGTDHGMGGKTFPACARVFPDGR